MAGPPSAAPCRGGGRSTRAGGTAGPYLGDNHAGCRGGAERAPRAAGGERKRGGKRKKKSRSRKAAGGWGRGRNRAGGQRQQSLDPQPPPPARNARCSAAAVMSAVTSAGGGDVSPRRRDVAAGGRDGLEGRSGRGGGGSVPPWLGSPLSALWRKSLFLTLCQPEMPFSGGGTCCPLPAVMCKGAATDLHPEQWGPVRPVCIEGPFSKTIKTNAVCQAWSRYRLCLQLLQHDCNQATGFILSSDFCCRVRTLLAGPAGHHGGVL